jgi:hypothetical protein
MLFHSGINLLTLSLDLDPELDTDPEMEPNPKFCPDPHIMNADLKHWYWLRG